MNASSNDKCLAGIVALLLCVLSLSLIHSPGTVDVPGWQEWYQNIVTYGLRDGFARNSADYPPLTSMIFWGLKWIAYLFSLDSFIAIKLSIVVFHLLTTFIFWATTRDLVLATVFHLALLLNTVLLGYIDIYFAPFLLVSLWAIQRNKLLLFAIFYSCAFLTKWQPIIIAPFLLLYLLEIKEIGQWKEIQFKRLGRCVVLPGLAILLTMLGIFRVAFVESFLRAISHEQLSAYGLNFNWVATYLLQALFPEYWGHLNLGRAYIIDIDLLSAIGVVPKLLFLAAYVLLLVSFFKQEKTFEKLIVYSMMGYYAYFTFNTGVHENHLFLPCLFSAVLLWLNRTYALISAFIMIMTNINLFIFYGVDGEPTISRVVFGLDMTVVFALFNTVFFFLVFVDLMRRQPDLNKSAMS